MLNTCTEHDDAVVVHDTKDCPVCKLTEKISELEETATEKDERITELETEVEELEKEKNEPKV